MEASNKEDGWEMALTAMKTSKKRKKASKINLSRLCPALKMGLDSGLLTPSDTAMFKINTTLGLL